jgi:hypothetical protein
MISERELAQYFHSFWLEHFPLLNAAFMRRFNAQEWERVHANEGYPIRPIAPGKNVERFDLVAELAFEWAASSLQKGEPDRIDATAGAMRRVAALQGAAEISAPTTFEIAEANALTETYGHFFRTVVGDAALQFRPLIKGAGVLNQMEGDFCSADTLYEVKTVNRNLLSADLRQVIVYLVAGLGSRQYAWKRYCIFNPRIGIYFAGEVNELLEYLSGRTPPECVNDAMDALLEREQPLEVRF